MLSCVIKPFITLGIYVSLFLGVLPSYGALVKQQVETRLSPQDSVRIQGYRGKIIIKKTTYGQLKAVAQIYYPEESVEGYFQNWKLALERKDSVVRVFMKGPQTKNLWIKNLREKKIPKVRLVIYMPERHMEVFWKEGEIALSHWQGNIQIHLMKGNIKIEGGTGKTQIVQHRGNLWIKGRKGSLNVESYYGQVQVKEHQGAVQVSNFEGHTHLEKIEGPLQLSQNKGRVELIKNQGDLEFKNKSAQVKIIHCEGAIRGRSQSGPIFADLTGEIKVNLRTTFGGVRLKLRNSGSYMNLGTKQGSLFTPSYLRVTRYSSIKVVKGRLRGQEKGRVFVRTESGNIQIL